MKSSRRRLFGLVGAVGAGLAVGAPAAAAPAAPPPQPAPPPSIEADGMRNRAVVVRDGGEIPPWLTVLREIEQPLLGRVVLLVEGPYLPRWYPGTEPMTFGSSAELSHECGRRMQMCRDGLMTAEGDVLYAPRADTGMLRTSYPGTAEYMGRYYQGTSWDRLRSEPRINVNLPESVDVEDVTQKIVDTIRANEDRGRVVQPPKRIDAGDYFRSLPTVERKITGKYPRYGFGAYRLRVLCACGASHVGLPGKSVRCPCGALFEMVGSGRAIIAKSTMPAGGYGSVSVDVESVS